MDIKGTDTGINLEAVRKMLQAEVKNVRDEELRKGAAELVEEQRKGVREVVEEQKRVIWEVVGEEKKAIRARVKDLQHFTIKNLTLKDLQHSIIKNLT